jgi:CRP-like cAMP-binding protein
LSTVHPPFSIPQEFRAPLEHVAEPQTVPARTFLFQRGDPVRGVYLVRSGRVALSLPHSPEPPRIAGPGSILGLPASIGSRPYSLTAETLESVEVGFIPHSTFVELLKRRPEVCLAVIETLALELSDARRQASALLDRLPAIALQ